MRVFTTFKIDKPEEFLKRFLNWAGNFPISCILNSNDYGRRHPHPFARHSYDLLAGTGCLKSIAVKEDGEWQKPLDNFIRESNDWIFGHAGYDLKNKIENLVSIHPDQIGFPMLYFFIPQFVFIIEGTSIKIGWHSDNNSQEDAGRIFDEILNYTLPGPVKLSIDRFRTIIPKDNYLQSVKKIREHIQRGDIYQMNFCQEFLGENVTIDAIPLWIKLLEASPTPFSCFYRFDYKYLLCASPERFLKKTGNLVYSQPIKGTAPRGTTIRDDRQIKDTFINDPKERAENIMITDLVRNDLARIALRGTVKVNELCGVYPFPGVYQMQSDISAELPEDIKFSRIMESAFPMGSMTGAPKVRAMEIIEQFERSMRGLYSGSVGYITPGLDFDFNVVIRSIQYNLVNKSLSFMVGGAITNKSEPLSEYRECLLKAKAILKVLGVDIT